ncbi:hypothetical protein [Flavobacterium channae]|uniref:hypothetical protein n=1 Tax=Flavobacterium channae TaxID=2897181 RepID=UPI001E5659E6|nr:hypothetical protein [Flavobacterium channae]UGS22779.1 hypothetical protein LOS89_08305 [Flavobacterium channae]
MKNQIIISLLTICGLTSCSNNSDDNYEAIPQYPFVEAKFGSSVDLENLANYANQSTQAYIIKDNSLGNTITDAEAT